MILLLKNLYIIIIIIKIIKSISIINKSENDIILDINIYPYTCTIDIESIKLII